MKNTIAAKSLFKKWMISRPLKMQTKRSNPFQKIRRMFKRFF
ncbi:hypothetical protein [Bacillus mojavensis]|nr:hypothetical protein [Bacillus mojavensis]MEC1666185.1 hypothetical protein [Bacillus mojavensis]MEC1752350.1 hypothetical protein [Bacillus mojavensis]